MNNERTLETRLDYLERRVAALEVMQKDARILHTQNGSGGKLFKEWAYEEAARCGVGVSAIYNRFARGKYPDLKTRCVNARVLYVLT